MAIEENSIWASIKAFVSPTSATIAAEDLTIIEQTEAEEDVEGSRLHADVLTRRLEGLVNRDRLMIESLRQLYQHMGIPVPVEFPATVDTLPALLGTNLSTIRSLNPTNDQVLGAQGNNLSLGGLIGLGVARIGVLLERPVTQNYASLVANQWNRRLFNVGQVTAGWLNLENTGSLTGRFTITRPGTYLLFAYGSQMNVDSGQMRLWNVTTNSLVVEGLSSQTITATAISGQSLATVAPLVGVFSVATTTAFEVQHNVRENFTANLGNGIVNIGGGAPTGISGINDVFSSCHIIGLV